MVPDAPRAPGYIVIVTGLSFPFVMIMSSCDIDTCSLLTNAGFWAVSFQSFSHLPISSFNSVGLTTQISFRASTHLLASWNILVKISAGIRTPSSCVNMKCFDEYTSCIHATDIRCVRAICRIVGFRPVLITCSIAVLSSKKRICFCFGNKRCHSSSPGRPTIRNAWLVDTISASGVDVETQPCLLLIPVTGQKDLGPLIDRNTPVVDFAVGTCPAKSASAARTACRFSASSAIQPICTKSMDESMYSTSLCNRLSQSLVHLVNEHASHPIIRYKSILTKRAP